jgi:hypothetical protein
MIKKSKKPRYHEDKIISYETPWKKEKITVKGLTTTDIIILIIVLPALRSSYNKI